MPNETKNPVQRNLHGIGISALSIENLDSAIPEEILANKEIGLFAVCAPSDNAPMSYSYLSHCREHMKRFAQTCIDENTMGDIFRISFDNKLAKSVTGTDNLFVNEVGIGCGSKAPVFMRFSLDMSMIDRESQSNLFNFDNIGVAIQFATSKNGHTAIYEINETIAGINSKAFALNFDDLPDKEDVSFNDYAVILKSFTVRVPEGFDISHQSLILHDALVCIN